MKKNNAYITKIAGFMDVSGKKTISSLQSEKINQFFKGLEFYKKKGYTNCCKIPCITGCCTFTYQRILFIQR